MSAPDLFGDRADEYARIRPTYPEPLFDHLERLAIGHERAWDCGAGSGQTARSLAGRFARVLATDSSLRQLAKGAVSGAIQPVASTAEAAPFRDRCVDLVTVSAAIHWFDRPRFYAEIRRVARPGAVVAVWSYYRSDIEPEVDAIMMRFASEVVGALWPAGFEVNRNGYRDLDFPFERSPWPELAAQQRMRLRDVCDYMRTWSASQTWERMHRADPVEVVREELARAWGDPERERIVHWPLHGVIGRVT